MLVSLTLLITFMTVLFACLIYNLIIYVIYQGRYKTFHITWFYIFAGCIVVLRMINFTYLMILLVDQEA